MTAHASPNQTLVFAPRAEQAPSAISSVIKSVLAGGLVVGLGAATLAELVVQPLTGHVLSGSELWLVSMLGGVLGLVAGSGDGAAEAFDEDLKPAVSLYIVPKADEPQADEPRTNEPQADEPQTLLRSA